MAVPAAERTLEERHERARTILADFRRKRIGQKFFAYGGEYEKLSEVLCEELEVCIEILEPTRQS